MPSNHNDETKNIKIGLKLTKEKQEKHTIA